MALEALKDLKEKEVLVFRHRMRPNLLFSYLQEFEYEIIEDKENYFEMRIYKKNV